MSRLLNFVVLLGCLVSISHCRKKEQIPQPRSPGEKVQYPENYCDNIDYYEEFDYVVVGSGPGGSTVARRLAEDPKNKVILLEAGDDPPTASDIPGQATELIKDPNVRWFFTAEEQETICQAVVDKRCPIVPGKVLGGGSILNFLMYIRGNAKDFDEWEEMGNTGWSYKDVLPYFKKLENYVALPLEKGDVSPTKKAASEKYHGTDGPFTTASFQVDERSKPIRDAIKEACAAVGIPFNYDVMGESQMGITEAPGFVDQLGYRYNIAKAYLLNIPDNLKVCKGAIVDKVGLRMKRADNVEFLMRTHKGLFGIKRFIIKVKKEVIVAAGGLTSPGVLERSGIGSPLKLITAGVIPKHVLHGVGENFHDQYVNFGNAFLIDWSTNASLNPMTTGMTSLTSFINTKQPNATYPDIQFVLKAYEPIFGQALQFSKSIRNQLDNAGRDILFYGNVVLVQGKPGHVHIRQAVEPYQPPRIVMNQYQTKEDKNALVRSSWLSRKMMSQDAMKEFNVEPFIFKECQKHKMNSKEEIMCQASLLATTLYHHTGTCKMGPKSDKSAVVDPRLRVHGIKGLRVCDSSVMPKITRGNTQIPTVMIAEKCADMIKEDNK